MKGRKVKKLIGTVLALCLTLSLFPLSAAFATDSITITLDNGVYDSTFTSTYGTVEYSPDGATGWKSIAVDTVASGSVYTITGASVYLRVNAVSPNTAQLMDGGRDSIPLTNNAAQLVTDNWHLNFTDSSGGGGGEGGGGEAQPITITLDNGVYDSTFTSTYGTVEYSLDEGAHWDSIATNTTYAHVTDGGQNSHNYTFAASVTSLQLRTVAESPNTAELMGGPGSNMTLTDNVAQTVTGSWHLNFNNGGGGGGGEGGNDPQPPQPPQPQSVITITLDNGVYDSAFANVNGTVEYKIGDGAWTALNVGTTATGAGNNTDYSFGSAASIKLRVNINSPFAAQLMGYGQDNETIALTNLAEQVVSESCHLNVYNPSGQQPGGEPITYPMKAYFSGVAAGVEMDESGYVQLPTGWTQGTVTFKAQVYFLDGNSANQTLTNLSPNDGSNPAGAVAGEVLLTLEGINNSEAINRTVIPGARGADDRPESVEVLAGFTAYGRAGLHLCGPSNSNITVLAQLVTADLINISADAHYGMSFNYGSANVQQAVVTQATTHGKLSIFFGNESVTLTAGGARVEKINALIGARYVSNADGSVTLDLPALELETTTTLRLAILLKDGTTIYRDLDVARTAITLSADERTNEVKAGYVINKGYLYDNKTHDESGFDAYYQVILYSGDTVVGYKQVQIDDKAIVDSLRANESYTMEPFDDDPIVLYNNEIEGVDKIGVFLTDGPVDVNSDTLPSIEFGIGAGVTVEWEAE